MTPLEDHFRAHPGEWLDVPDIAKDVPLSGGVNAIPARVVELRRTRQMQIQHTFGVATEDGQQIHFSRYRFIPQNFEATAVGPAHVPKITQSVLI